MLKVLIAEDELMIADLLEETLTAAGYEVCGIARTVDEAAALAILTRADGSAAIAKPYVFEDVATALLIVREIMSRGTATPPFPAGFRLLPEPASCKPPA